MHEKLATDRRGSNADKHMGSNTDSGKVRKYPIAIQIGIAIEIDSSQELNWIHRMDKQNVQDESPVRLLPVPLIFYMNFAQGFSNLFTKGPLLLDFGNTRMEYKSLTPKKNPHYSVHPCYLSIKNSEASFLFKFFFQYRFFYPTTFPSAFVCVHPRLI